MTPAARPQTIQIFLPLGDPRGIRIAEIATRIVQLIEVPRPQLDVFYRSRAGTDARGEYTSC